MQAIRQAGITRLGRHLREAVRHLRLAPFQRARGLGQAVFIRVGVWLDALLATDALGLALRRGRRDRGQEGNEHADDQSAAQRDRGVHLAVGHENLLRSSSSQVVPKKNAYLANPVASPGASSLFCHNQALVVIKGNKWLVSHYFGAGWGFASASIGSSLRSLCARPSPPWWRWLLPRRSICRCPCGRC